MAGKVARAASAFGRNTGAMDTSLTTTMHKGHPTRFEDCVGTPARERLACQMQAKRSYWSAIETCAEITASDTSRTNRGRAS